MLSVELIGYFLIFVAGAFIGSFLNVVSDRVPQGLSPIKGRSKCDSCGTALKAKDLIPLLSFLFLRGKCRYCGHKLSFYYPISEILTGLTFVGLASYLTVFAIPNPMIWVTFAYLAVVASFLIVILLADLKFKIIPNKVVIPAILFVLFVMVTSLGLIAYSSYNQLAADPFGQYLLQVGYWQEQMIMLARTMGLTIASAFGIAAFFYLLIVITKGKGMGGGDVKLAFLIGLVNGFPMNIVAIILGFLTGAVFSVVMVLAKRKAMKDVIPFGPFLVLGCFLAFAFGQTLFDWYVGLL